MKTFRASGFAAKFRQALQEHNEPEVLSFDNWGVLSGIKTSTGWIEGIVRDPQTAPSLIFVHEAFDSLQPHRGWVMLVSSATNHEAARALSMQPPLCNSDSAPVVNPTTIDPALRQASEAATLAARAYLTCDQSTLLDVSDASRLSPKCFLADSETQVDSVKACRVSGNRNLAFVSLRSIFTSRVPLTNLQSWHVGDLGQQSILAVLRNRDGAWRLLAMTHDALNTVRPIPLSTQTFESSLDDGQSATTPGTARLLTADGVYPLPKPDERFGYFIWEPSQSTDVIGQVAEFIIGRDSSSGFTRLFFLPPHEGKLSSGYLMSGGTSVWRVWSISKGGDVSFSEHHTFTH